MRERLAHREKITIYLIVIFSKNKTNSELQKPSCCHTTALGTGRLFQGELLFNVNPGLKHLGYSV